MLLRHRIGLSILCLQIAGSLAAPALSADAPPAVIAAAVADAARPEADRVRDGDRKPAEVTALAGIKAGNKVAEMWPGGGYFTRIFSKAVGPKGVVYAWVPGAPPNAPPGRDPAAGMRALAADANYGNLKVVTLDPAVALPETVDVVWTSLNYHDMHNRPNADMAAINKAALNALKPGGLYVVIDHAAEKGSGTRDTQKFHRIDEDLVKQEVMSVGFESAGDSALLRHADDAHDKSSHEVERGKTDQFLLMFRKPRK
jgi:predicted methyltransferase